MAKSSHVILTSHSDHIFKGSMPICWGAKSAKKRGPIIASLSDPFQRNAIGSYSGSYCVYRALSIASNHSLKDYTPDLQNTSALVNIGPYDSWFDKNKIVTFDPYGANVLNDFADLLKKKYHISPTIAVTQAHLNMPEIKQAILDDRLNVDGKIVKDIDNVKVTKAAVEPVWYLPGIARRLNLEEGDLRKILFEQTGGMFPELVTRPDLSVLLPPIGGATAYIFGDVKNLANTKKKLTCRVHDECNGSDVFGSDICTCRPYLTHAVEKAIATAQNGGVGLVVYFRKEGRALGEVTKYLVYNARKRQKGGDLASEYFQRTECVAGVQDARFQEFMPDILHWFGIKKIDNLMSMSDMKYDAITSSGIKVKNRVTIPDDLIPKDAQVEIEAKKASGYFSKDKSTKKGLKKIKGRDFYAH